MTMMTRVLPAVLAVTLALLAVACTTRFDSACSLLSQGEVSVITAREPPTSVRAVTPSVCAWEWERRADGTSSRERLLLVIDDGRLPPAEHGYIPLEGFEAVARWDRRWGIMVLKSGDWRAEASTTGGLLPDSLEAHRAAMQAFAVRLQARLPAFVPAERDR